MNLAWLSLGALVVAMVVSCVSELNVGVLALALMFTMAQLNGTLDRVAHAAVRVCRVTPGSFPSCSSRSRA